MWVYIINQWSVSGCPCWRTHSTGCYSDGELSFSTTLVTILSLDTLKSCLLLSTYFRAGKSDIRSFVKRSVPGSTMPMRRYTRSERSSQICLHVFHQLLRSRICSQYLHLRYRMTVRVIRFPRVLDDHLLTSTLTATKEVMQEQNSGKTKLSNQRSVTL